MEDQSIELGIFLENTRKLGRSQRISGRLCAERGVSRDAQNKTWGILF